MTSCWSSALSLEMLSLCNWMAPLDGEMFSWDLAEELSCFIGLFLLLRGEQNESSAASSIGTNPSFLERGLSGGWSKFDYWLIIWPGAVVWDVLSNSLGCSVIISSLWKSNWAEYSENARNWSTSILSWIAVKIKPAITPASYGNF